MPDRFASQFAADLDRRRVLAGLAGGIGGLVLAGCGSRAGAQAVAAQECPVTPTEIRGPFPADGVGGHDRTINVLALDGAERGDIRASFAGMAGEAAGVPLAIELALAANPQDCAALAGHAVYLWQCDARGDYSLYTAPQVNYLRGLQQAGADGVVRFTSIVPGCYGGRAPHLHLEVFRDAAAAVAGEAPLLVSQLGLPPEPCDAVYADAATYGDSAANHARWPATRDWAFRGADRAHMVLAMDGDVERGFTARATVALG
ncbi:intradiol ring-cleavage dioxygenase [Altererythrobacter sp. KTW20L]|uniref:intradiol ring-cleavage dioxygenase n=1 Tax=Altererythrobacter sp. KTW20L TaxID=2942210 RepID=UPI0020BDC416|nr:intradiol ring-cleavage dioxygenase [Altererythrobacter sp. KTW20L]MCL6250682.1 intradiol ring-cleavage dioxygenase [Altererythrobacter sp. KTW20L]